MIRMYWKRCEASVINSVRRFRHDPFFRTEISVLGLQAAFTVVILIVVTQGTTLLYKNISGDLLTHAAQSRVTTDQVFAIVGRAAQLKTDTVLGLGSIIFLVTALFGYLILRLALAPARAALASQKQFIGNIAHELRTPLSIIKTNTEVRLLDSDVPQRSKEMMRDNLEELDRISDIINNLLSLNVLIRPEDIAFSNIDVGPVVEKMARHLDQLIERKNLHLTITQDTYTTVWGNATALEQVVLNVLRNAANYTPHGGTIRVSIKPDYQGYVVVAVEDTGEGIAERDLKRIFEPFYRADQSRTRGKGGSGLGLAIVNELVKIHNGLITIQSAEGKGTSVFISLPSGKEDALTGREEETVRTVQANYTGKKNGA